jgi:hypothetical protein
VKGARYLAGSVSFIFQSCEPVIFKAYAAKMSLNRQNGTQSGGVDDAAKPALQGLQLPQNAAKVCWRSGPI